MSFVPHSTQLFAPPIRGLNPRCRILIGDGLLSEDDASSAENIARLGGQRLAHVLSSNFGIAELSIADAFSTLFQTSRINPCECQPDLSLLNVFGPSQAIQKGLMPWRQMGGNTVVLTDKPDHFDRHIPDLTAQFGSVRMAITTRAHLETAISTMFRVDLVHAAETKTPTAQSSRTWRASRALTIGAITLLTLLFFLVVFPKVTFSVLCAWAIVKLVRNTVLKTLAAIACYRRTSNNNAPDVVPARDRLSC